MIQRWLMRAAAADAAKAHPRFALDGCELTSELDRHSTLNAGHDHRRAGMPADATVMMAYRRVEADGIP